MIKPTTGTLLPMYMQSINYYAYVSNEAWPGLLNPQAPVAQKIADEVVFRHFQGEGAEFF